MGVGRGETDCWVDVSIKGKLNVERWLWHSEGTKGGAIQVSGAVGGETQWVCLAAGRDACVKVNESRSEFADKEENTEFLAKLGEVEEGGENGEKDNKKIVCVIVCTRNGHEMGLIGQSTAVDLISVILPSAFIVSPIRVFSSQSSIVPLPQG